MTSTFPNERFEMAQICKKTNKHFDSVTDIALDEMERQLAACAGHLPALFVYIFLDVVFGVKVKFFYAAPQGTTGMQRTFLIVTGTVSDVNCCRVAAVPDDSVVVDIGERIGGG